MNFNGRLEDRPYRSGALTSFGSVFRQVLQDGLGASPSGRAFSFHRTVRKVDTIYGLVVQTRPLTVQTRSHHHYV